MVYNACVLIKGGDCTENVKNVVAKNITDLRLLNNMTQMELGEKLNYSDKTISKWERGESTPDVAVLVEMADIFGVTLDYLVRSENIDQTVVTNKEKQIKYNRKAITYTAESLVWIIAVFAFIITALVSKTATFRWLYFVYAVPVVLIVRLVFNSIWFNPRFNYFIVSALMWAILATIQCTFLYFKKDVMLIYLLGVAGQIIIVLASFIKKPKKK